MKSKFRQRHVYAKAQLGTRLLERNTNKTTLELPGLQEEDSAAQFFFSSIFFGGFFDILFILNSALLHLPPLRFHCPDGCWDRTQDHCN
jgi:hypothetical protein